MLSWPLLMYIRPPCSRLSTRIFLQRNTTSQPSFYTNLNSLFKMLFVSAAVALLAAAPAFGQAIRRTDDDGKPVGESQIICPLPDLIQ